MTQVTAIRNDRAVSAVANTMTAGHRIAITPSRSHVVVSLGGEKIAESDRALALEETGLPTRYYFPREDVRVELLTPTSRASSCPFKGDASYWSVQVGPAVHENVVWSYETPIPAAAEIAGLLCFYNEHVDLSVNGVDQARPETPYSAS